MQQEYSKFIYAPVCRRLPNKRCIDVRYGNVAYRTMLEKLPCTKLRKALRLPRRDVRILVGLLTGHNTLNRHLALLKKQSDALCPLCEDEQETSR